MKALPLWQPWATLVAIEAKRVETRGYPPTRLGLRPGERIAIHATKTEQAMGLCGEEPFCSALNRAGYHFPLGHPLPLGALVATCVLDRYAQIAEDSADELERRQPDERAFGDYTPGRYAWVLRDVERLAKPIPWKGSQGTFDVPDDVLGSPARAQGALL